MKRVLALLSLGLLVWSCDPPETEVAVSSVSLNKSSAELKVGETLRLSATVSPADATNKTVTWSSSNASVATVSPSGEVAAVAVGSANITASAGSKSASCAVTVVNPVVQVSSVTLDKDRLDLTVGGTAKLTATVSPADATDKAVTWESSDASVATVDNDGNVKALKGGTSTITAKAGGKSATALVDVMDITPTSVEIGAEGGDIRVTVIADRKVHVSSTPDWVKEKSLSGNVFTFTVAANPETAERSGVVVICDDVGSCLPCTVKQAGKDIFEISPTTVSIGAEGGTFDVSVTSTQGYHISSTPDWVKQKSLKDNVYTFTVEANPGTTERKGVVVICDDKGTCLSCEVKQAGKDVFEITPTEVSLGAEGGTFDVSVTATRSYHISSTPDWVKQASQKDNVYTFEVEANPGTTERKGVIVICDDKGTCLSCVVKQAGKDVFEITPIEVSLGAEGGTFDVSVTATRSYHISSTPDWVKQKSQNDNVYTFEVEANPTTTERKGVVVICDDKGTCLSCVVKQAGAKIYLTVEPASMEFDINGGTATVKVSSNAKWTVAADASWCEMTPTSGEGDGSFIVKVGEYKVEGRRTATVTISGEGDLVKTVAVEQEGIVPFDVNPRSVDLGEEGGTFDIKVTSSYGYHISGMSEWITQESVSGKVHTFRAQANPDYEMRKGVVTFCDDEGTCLSVEVRQARHIAGPDEVDWSKDFYHRSLVMHFANASYGNCPPADRAVKAAQARRPGKIEPVTIHYDNRIQFPQASTLENQYSVNGSYPTLVVDGRYRVKRPYEMDFAPDEMIEEVDGREANFPTVSAIGWDSSISGDKLTVTTHVFFKESGEYKYTVLLVEDGVRYGQYDNDYGGWINYVSNGVARAALSSVSGEYYRAYGSKAVTTKTFTVDIPDSWVKENLRILVYVQRAYGKMMKIHPSDYDDYFIDNCSSGKAGGKMLPAVVSTTSGGNEDATEGKPINW